MESSAPLDRETPLSDRIETPHLIWWVLVLGGIGVLALQALHDPFLLRVGEHRVSQISSAAYSFPQAKPKYTHGHRKRLFSLRNSLQIKKIM